MEDKEKADYRTSEALNGIEVVNAQYKKQSFSKHVHESYTIGVIEEGAQRFFRSGANHVAGKNSIILVNADDVHNGETATEGGWRYKAIYPTVEHFDLISQDFLGNHSLVPYFKSSVIEDELLANQLRLIHDQIEIGASKLMVETLLCSTLFSIASKYGKPLEQPSDVDGCRKRLLQAKEFLDAHPEVDISLDSLANLTGYTKYHFVRQFGQAFGISPHAYQIQARLQKSKGLLKAGVAIADVASDCGFHDQSHFTRHFKKALGTTPKYFQTQATLYKS